MNDAERQEYLQGQVQALLACIFGLIHTHHDMEHLSSSLEQRLESCLATLGGEAHAEQLIDGIQDIKAKVLGYVANAGKRQTDA